jgi:hypothetical protein
MDDAQPPSGPWTGFYVYHRQPDRHRMDLGLTFANGTISGEGNDDIGAFVIRGRYEAGSREYHWTKTYVGQHDVFYRGFGEGEGIWGVWEVGGAQGGFKIWPVSSGEDAGDQERGAETIEVGEPVEAVGAVPGFGNREAVEIEVGLRRHPPLCLWPGWNLWV